MRQEVSYDEEEAQWLECQFQVDRVNPPHRIEQARKRIAIIGRCRTGSDAEDRWIFVHDIGYQERDSTKIPVLVA